MPSNDAIARRLHEMSQMMDILGEDSFRSAAHARAARAVESLSIDVAKIAPDKNQLKAIEGIGAKMADKIHEYVTTGAIREHAELLARLPSGLLCLLDIQGLGPKTIRNLWQQASVTDLASLEKAIDSGALLSLPRMGQKSIDKLKQAISFYKSQQGSGPEGAPARRLHLGIAMPIAEQVVDHLSAAVPGVRIAFAGSLRRGRETIGDIDILAAPRSQQEADALTRAFTTMPGVVTVLAAGGTRASVQVGLSDSLGRWGSDPSAAAAGVQMDLKLVPPDSWGAAMMYFTGSKEHNVSLRERARKKGLTLNEYGLYPEDDPDRKLDPPQKRGVAPVCKADSEESVYAALGLPYLPPECREDLGELAFTQPPRLIELADVKAELHAHTTASDGRLSILELAEHAKSRGFHTIAVTDHSRSSAVAGGLSVDRLLEHIDAVRAAASRISGITILAGSEVDILSDGRLDYDDDILRRLDVVVASPHAALSQSPEVATARLLKVIEHPLVHILGHPTGRQINRRPGLSPDMEALIAAAARHNVALEINTHWMRLDLRDVHARAAARAGCLIALDSDVHEPSDFDNLRYGVMTARRAGIAPGQCINTWPADRLHAWLKSKR